MRPPVSRSEWFQIFALTLAFWSLQVFLAWRTGITVDEPSHLVSAHLYWQGTDTLNPGDMPPLIKLAGGWTGAITGLKLPPRSNPCWNSNHEWEIALTWMDGMPKEVIQRVFFAPRVMVSTFGVAALLLVWWWGRQLFGPVPGILTAACFALSPLVLGHSHLFKNDLAASFGLLALAHRAFRLKSDPSLRNTVWLGAAALLAISAKYSLAVFAAGAPVAALAISLSHGKGLLRSISRSMLVCAVLWAGICLAWPGPIAPAPDSLLQETIRQGSAGRLYSAASSALSHVPLPVRFWQGASSLVQSNNSDIEIHFLGQLRHGGHPAYFVVAWLVKEPELLILLVAAGSLLLLRTAFHRQARDHWFWLAPGAAYFVFASLSNLQLGLRLVLPALTCAMLATGLAWKWLLRRGNALPTLTLALLAASTFHRFPHFLTYFNEASGGTRAGLRYVSDSNVDWGQGLPDLGEWIRQHPQNPVNLFYFGMGNPGAYLPSDSIVIHAAPWSADLAQGSHFKPKPGIYAISPALLTGQLFAPEYRDYFSAFKPLTPIAQPGGAFLIYDFRPRETAAPTVSPLPGAMQSLK